MKEKINFILAFLGLSKKAEEKTLDQTDWDKFAEAYKEKYGTDFYEDMRNEQANAQAEAVRKEKEEQHDAALLLLADVKGKDISEKVQEVIKENIALKNETEPDNPKKEKMEIKTGSFGLVHTDAHVFGIDHKLFDRSKRYNSAMLSAKVRESQPSRKDAEVFEADFAEYGEMLAARYAELSRLGYVSGAQLNVDYGDLSNAGLGDQYMARRMDAVIARILEVPDVTEFFPRRYGIQDRELITNAFFGEFSSAYQEGEIFKGSMELQPEMGHVDDAMMKTNIGTFKWIEKTYLGYWNTAGSDPFKPTQLEWTAINIGKRLRVEQNERNLLGYYIKPTPGVLGSYLNAANGVIHTLLGYIEQNKMLALDDPNLADYDATNMVDVVEEFLAAAHKVNPYISEFELLLNRAHRPWFTASYRAKYGKDLDFTGNTNRVPDFDVNIRFVPNEGNIKLMLLQRPGNLQLLEFVPGEMYKMYFERRLENLLAMSVWKEGVSAAHVGRQFSSPAELVANNYQYQQIFMNKPAVTLEADATGFDVNQSLWFVTGENTDATALDATAIKNAKPGLVFKVELGSTVNPTSIDNSGSFSLTAAWTPTAKGAWIKLVYNAGTGKFDEVARSA